MYLTIAATVLDATIVGFVAFSNLESPTQHYLVLFVGIFVLFSFCGLILLKASNERTSREMPKRFGTKIRWLTVGMFTSQFIIIGILLSIISQMFLFNSYQIMAIAMEIYITHLSGLFFLACLIGTLARWIRSNKNVMLLSYSVSFILLFMYLAISCIYLTLQMSYYPPLRLPQSIHFSVTSPQGARPTNSIRSNPRFIIVRIICISVDSNRLHSSDSIVKE